jgi:hypothetical protein
MKTSKRGQRIILMLQAIVETIAIKKAKEQSSALEERMKSN